MQNKTLITELAAPQKVEFVARKPFTLVLDFLAGGSLDLNAVSPSGRKVLVDTYTTSQVIGRSYGCGTTYELDLTAGTITAQLNQL